jgi:hypothetical protein
MSVNLSRSDRVIIMVAIIGVALSTLGWSGDLRLTPASRPGQDTIPSRHPGEDRRTEKPATHEKGEGRVARELDLRLDLEEPEELPHALMVDVPVDPDLDVDLALDMEGLKGLNARIEADVMKNVEAWKHQELAEPDALEVLQGMEIDEDALQILKDLNIDEDMWNELRELKIEMDYLKEDIDSDISKYFSDPRVHAEVERVIEAVKEEIPRMRREVERAMQSWHDSRKQWQ